MRRRPKVWRKHHNFYSSTTGRDHNRINICFDHMTIHGDKEEPDRSKYNYVAVSALNIL